MMSFSDQILDAKDLASLFIVTPVYHTFCSYLAIN
jgi:hypothetical protein